MSDGFLDDIPKLDLPNGKRKAVRPGARKKQARPEPPDIIVYYVRVKCPNCKGLRCPVYNSNHLPIRYHRCLDCGCRFKSVEKEIPPNGTGLK